MSLTLSLNNALSGLNVNQRSLSTLSQNIANANNPNYSRKVVNQSAVYLDGEGAGVSIASISRTIDQYLQTARQSQTGNVGRANTLVTYSDRLQIFLGTPGSSNSLDAYIGSFFNGVQTLSATPESSSLRLSAVNAGVTLGRQVSDLATSMENLRFQADGEIASAFNDVNRALKQLHNLNVAIGNAYAVGQSQSELLDQRDQLTREIAEKMDINLFYRQNGTVNIYAAGGKTLLDTDLYQISYEQASAVSAFQQDTPLNPAQIFRVDERGNRIGEPQELIAGGPSSVQVPTVNSGTVRALLDVRDRKLPNTLAQMDMLASRMRDQINMLHNKGAGYPGANQLTGTRLVNAGEVSGWNGGVRIALTDAQGRPIPSFYSDQASGLMALDLDLSSLNAGQGQGQGFPSTQTIIDEINNHFGAPQPKARIGNLNNVQLALASQTIPGIPPLLSFDFDLENISGSNADFFVTNVRVLDDANTDITSVTNTIPAVNLHATNTFQTTAGSTLVTVNTATPHTFVEGQKVYISNPGSTVNGIPQAELNQFFTITNVTATSFDIVVDTAATATGNVGVVGQKVMPKYDTVTPGDQKRTTANGNFTANLSGNLTTLYYTVAVEVAVDDGQGGFTTSTVQYRVLNNQSNVYNKRVSANAVAGGELEAPGINTPYARAMLVDADGNELPKYNGAYSSAATGYLAIRSENSNYYVSIDSLDSAQTGRLDRSPPIAGTNRGFSYFFELNNFFKSNSPTSTGDTVLGSARNLAVEDRIVRNPNLFSTGTLSRSSTPAGADSPYYTYDRNIADNSIIQQIALLSAQTVSFDGAGGLAFSQESFSSYAGTILGNAAAEASAAASELSSAQTLQEGFDQRATAIAGVNMDEELANTIIYQNAYAASARIITVVSSLFEALIDAAR